MDMPNPVVTLDTTRVTAPTAPRTPRGVRSWSRAVPAPLFGLRRPTTSPRRFPFGSPHPITYRHRPALELPSAEGFFSQMRPGRLAEQPRLPGAERRRPIQAPPRGWRGRRGRPRGARWRRPGRAGEKARLSLGFDL